MAVPTQFQDSVRVRLLVYVIECAIYNMMRNPCY